MQKLIYYLFRFAVLLFKIIPFWMLYGIADFVFFMLYRVTSYRKDVVRKNLKNSFPEKDEVELKKIEIGFYKNMADIFAESIKGFSMSKEELVKRYKVLNPELVEPFFNKGRSVIAYASHYTNWEWGVLCLSLQFKHKSVGFYKPLSNKFIDKHLRDSRRAWGMNLESIKNTRTVFEKYKEFPSIYFMIADQSPTNLDASHNINFLGRETLFLHGPAKYSKMYDYPTFYGEVSRVKRGYYTINIRPVVLEPSKTDEQRITEVAAKILEDAIGHNAADWLWSHRRWKHSEK